MAKWALWVCTLGSGLWGLTRSGFGSFGRSVALPDRADIPRNTKDPTRGLGRPEPRALGLALFFFSFDLVRW